MLAGGVFAFRSYSSVLIGLFEGVSVLGGGGGGPYYNNQWFNRVIRGVGGMPVKFNYDGHWLGL